VDNNRSIADHNCSKRWGVILAGRDGKRLDRIKKRTMNIEVLKTADAVAQRPDAISVSYE